MKGGGELRGIGTLDPAHFAARFIDLGLELGVLSAPRYDAELFAVVDGDVVHALADSYAAYLGTPASARAGVLSGMLAELVSGEVPKDSRPWQSVKTRVLPRLRNDFDVDRLAEGQDDRGPCTWHLCGDVYLTVVIDGDEVMTTVTHAMLRGWGVAPALLRRLALENLARASAAPLAELCPGVWIGPWEDAYAASRLLLAASLSPCAQPLLCVPSRDTLLVADAAHPAAATALVALIEELGAADHPISPQLFRPVHALGGDGELEATQLPFEHPACVRHMNLCQQARVERYAQQQARLQASLGGEIHVARAELDESGSGLFVTRALWTEGVMALLPEVDRVHLLSTAHDDTSSRILSASFEDIKRLGVLAPTPSYLPRYLTTRFPTDAELHSVAVPVARDHTTLGLRGR